MRGTTVDFDCDVHDAGLEEIAVTHTETNGVFNGLRHNAGSSIIRVAIESINNQHKANNRVDRPANP